MANKNAISLNPSTYTEGGFFVEGDYEISAEVVLYDFEGKAKTREGEATKVCCVKVTYDPVGGGDKNEQYYSVDDQSRFIPSGDGTEILPADEKNPKTIWVHCNFALWVQKLVEAGFPADKIGQDVSIFNGMVVHAEGVPQPKRQTQSKVSEVPAEQGQKKDRTIVIVTDVIKLPGEKKAGKAPAKAAAAPAASKANGKAAPSGESVESKLESALMTIMGADNPPTSKVKLSMEVHKLYKGKDDQSEVVAAARDTGVIGPILESMGFRMDDEGAIHAA